MYWHILTCTDRYWHVLTHTDTNWHTLTHTDMYWLVLTYIDTLKSQNDQICKMGIWTTNAWANAPQKAKLRSAKYWLFTLDMHIGQLNTDSHWQLLTTEYWQYYLASAVFKRSDKFLICRLYSSSLCCAFSSATSNAFKFSPIILSSSSKSTILDSPKKK